jgi:hypothetical protein
LRQSTPTKLTNDILGFFSAVSDMASSAPKDGVFQYAIESSYRSIRGQKPSAVYVDLLLTGMRKYPSAIPVGCRAILHLASKGWRPRRDMSASLEAQVADQAMRQNGVEVSWLLDVVLQLSCKISVAVAQSVGRMRDNPPLLFLLELEKQNLISITALRKSFAKVRAVHPGALYGEDWLLAYEAHCHGYVSNPTVPVDRNFSLLLADDVAFFLPKMKGEMLVPRRPGPGETESAIDQGIQKNEPETPRDEAEFDEWWEY